MPKLKSHKSSRRRLKITGTGKVMAHPTGGRHMMSGKSSKKRRHIRRWQILKSMDRKRTLRAQNMSPVAKPEHRAPAAATAPESKPQGA